MGYTIEEIKSLISTHFGLKGSVSQLPGEIDLNYLLTLPQGEKRTFKIANAKEKIENLEFQNALMSHLASANLGLEIPEIVSSLEGKAITIIQGKEGESRFIRMLTWVEGRPLAHVNPHSPDLLEKVGELCGKLGKSLAHFDHPASKRFIKWDLAQVNWIKPHIEKIGNKDRRETLLYFYNLHERLVKPELQHLRQSVIYNDGNDYNILVNHDLQNPAVPGVIDFGDAVYSHTINELAIAMAYALMHKPDPLQAGYHLVKGYHQIYPLEDYELKVLFPLIATRLIISVICSELNREEEPDNVYLQISDEAAWKLLDKLKTIPPSLAYYTFRGACGMTPCPQQKIFLDWIKTADLQPIISTPDLLQQHWLDLSVGSVELGNQSEVLDDEKLDQNIQDSIRTSGKTIGIGKYNEVRPFYTSSAFEHSGNEGPEWRTVHLGIDLFAPAGTPIFTPLRAEVISAFDNEGSRNYGPTVILKHDILPELTFYTLYGHLGRSSNKKLKVGDHLEAGAQVGNLGARHENGGWSPHLHFQIMLDLLDAKTDFNGVALPSQREVWTSLCPDPWWLIGKSASPADQMEDVQQLITFRKSHLGKNLSLSYQKPLHMVRGFRQFLFDTTGRKFLDTVNNVAHVGHEHPSVVRAGQQQMAVLNTNTRYLHKHIIRFTESLLSTMPHPLEVVFVVNSGSEANELALRMAKTYTGQKDMISVEVGYHGNTNACVDVSAYKFNGKGGKGAPEYTQVVPIPDTFRGIYRDPATAGREYASHLNKAVENVKAKGRKIAGFICESVLSCGGQVVLPNGYLKEAYQIVRNAGGVCIADEVQTGCGRVGSHFWAFETQGVVPDIVTIGKPIGNGHPLGVVVTTRAIAEAFANGMEYFSTFGGNPVSSVIGNEVLKVIENEGLQAHAMRTGETLHKELISLKKQYPVIGDVRGLGLFMGIELIKNDKLAPATEEAAYLANRMRELGVLMSTDGPYENVLKIKPPMVFDANDITFLLETLEKVMKEDRLIQAFN